MSHPPTPNTSPHVSPPASPIQNQDGTAPTANQNNPTPPTLSKIIPNDGKSCQALLITQKLLIENSNKVTMFFVDFHDLFSNMQTFVSMINAMITSHKTMETTVSELKTLFNEQTVQDIRDIPNIKERVAKLEKERHTPSPTFVLDIQKQLHYSTLGHVYQAKIESCAHRLVINGITKSST